MIRQVMIFSLKMKSVSLYFHLIKTSVYKTMHFEKDSLFMYSNFRAMIKKNK